MPARFNVTTPFFRDLEDLMADAIETGGAKGVENLAGAQAVSKAHAKLKARFGDLMSDKAGAVGAGSRTFEAYMERMQRDAKEFNERSATIKRLSMATSAAYGGFTYQRKQEAYKRRQVGQRFDSALENQEAFAKFLSDKGDKYGGDLDSAERDFAEYQKRRRGMSDERLRRRLGGLLVHALGAGPMAALQHVPVAGQAVGSFFNTTAAMRFMGAGWGGAIAGGGLAAVGAALGGAVHQGWSGEATDEQMRHRFGQISGSPYQAGGMISGLRRMGFRNEEMMRLAGLGRAQGDFEGVGALAKLDMTYGLGGEGIGTLAAMSRTGMKGDNTAVLTDAVASGVVQGLKPGRFGETLQGLTAILARTSIGVRAEGAFGINTLAAAFGKQGVSGEQAYSLISAMDGGMRGGGNPWSQSMAFMSAYQSMGGGSYWDVKKEQDKGIQGAGGLRRASGLMRLLARTSGVDRPGATQDNQDLFEMQIAQQFGVLPNAAGKIAATFKGGKIDEAGLRQEIEAAKPQQEAAYTAMVDQVGIMRSIDVKIEAIRVKLGATMESIGVFKGASKLLDVMQGNNTAPSGVFKEPGIFTPPNWREEARFQRTAELRYASEGLNALAPEDRTAISTYSGQIENALMRRVTSSTHSDINDRNELNAVATALGQFANSPGDPATARDIESRLSNKQQELLHQLLEQLASINKNTAEALRNGNVEPLFAYNPLDLETRRRNAVTTANQTMSE